MMIKQDPELLVRAGNEAVFITDKQAIINHNPAAAGLFGYPGNVLTGMNPVKLFAAEYQEVIKNALESGTGKTMEAQAVDAQNRKFDTQVHIKTICRGDDCYVSFTVRDISDFKLSHKELLAKDALLEAVSFAAARFLESKNWRDEIDPVLKYIGESAGVSRVYIFQNFENHRGSLFMSQKYEWVAPGIESQIDNPLLKELYYEENGLTRLIEILPKGKVLNGLVRLFPNAERTVLESQGIESLYLTPIFQAGHWWGFIGYDECNYERIWTKNEIHLLNTVADIFNSALDQEKMELSLNRTNENFKSLFNNSPDGIYVYDYNGYLLDANLAACQLNGIPKEQLVRRHVSQLVPPEDAPNVANDFLKWTTGEYTFIESKLINQNGDIIPVEIRGTQISYFDTPSVLLLARDISKRKETEMEMIEAKNRAEQSDRLKSAFLGQISHEMRTPLNSIIGFADMLKSELTDGDMKEMADFILKGGSRLLNTFNLILDLSEIEANVMQAQLEKLDLIRFIKQRVPSFIQNANEKNLDFSCLLKNEEIIVKSDEGLLEKIVFNLVDNALKYTRSGSITISAEVEPDADKPVALLKVRDTGIGIAPEKLRDIFSNFRQASEGHNREFEGAGLGLSVTKGMVQLMNGQITVNSEIGKGSTFTVRFPLVSSLPTDTDYDQPEPANPKRNELTPEILIVEDEFVHQKYLDYILKNGYELTFAESGIWGLELARTRKFDLIIMDINLGKDLNGIETLAQIRKINGYENIAAIAATANVMKGHKELFLSNGFTHYISKPYKANEMRTLVDTILNSNKMFSAKRTIEK
jgi:PAS domain S-box-containing protein